MALKEEKYSQRRLITSNISTVVGITLVLYMLGLLGLVVLHAKKISDYVKENIGFTVFLNDDTKEVDILQLQKTLDARNYVKSTEYITGEKASKDFEKELGENFISFIGEYPIPPSIEIRFKADYANADSLNALQKELEQNSIVSEVSYHESEVAEMNKNIRRISLMLLGISVLLMVISIALINNTIRLSVFSKRFLLRTMQLIGATESFIRRPFLLKGIVQGIISSVIAIILLVFTLYFAQKQIPDLEQLQDSALFIKLFIFVMVLGMVITWISTYLAVRKYLRIKIDYLYYH